MSDERRQPGMAGPTNTPDDGTVPHSQSGPEPNPGAVATGSGSSTKKGDDYVLSRLPLEPGVEPVPGYQLAELIGEGGFGQVWKAHGPGGFLVAIKFVRLGNRAEAVELRSLELMKNIRHANLLTVFGAWQDHGYLIIAMELADRTLLDYYHELTRQGLPGIPIPELFDYMLEAAKGIDYLNSLGIQHRDIKPHNLFLVGGSVKVADFGLAKVVEQKAASHTGTGMTPAYAAPEFFAGKTASQSDQYSLAVTYCHLRNGRLPFDGSAAQIMAGHFFEKPDVSALPPEEQPVVAQALDKKPENRWPSCRLFVQALVDASEVGHGPMQPPPVRATSATDRTEQIRTPKSKPRPSNPLIEQTEPLVKPKSSPLPGGNRAGAGPRRSGPSPKRPSGPRPPPKPGKALWIGLGVAAIAGLASVALIIWHPWQSANSTTGGDDASSANANRQNMPEFAVSFRHAPSVLDVAFFPDARRVVSAGKDHTLRIWDVRTGNELFTLRGHSAAVTCVAVSADGNLIASGSEDKTIKLWDPESGREVRTLRGHGDAVTSIAFAVNGKLLVTGSQDKTARVWSLDKDATAKPLEFKHDNWVSAVAFAPNSKRVLTAGVDPHVRLWDLEKGTVARTYEGNNDFVLRVAFAGDGSRVVSSGADKSIRIWKTDTGDVVKVLNGHMDRVAGIAVSHDGRRILSGGDDRTARFWDVDMGKEILPPKVYADKITSVSLTSDLSLGLCGSTEGAVRIWGLTK